MDEVAVHNAARSKLNQRKEGKRTKKSRRANPLGLGLGDLSQKQKEEKREKERKDQRNGRLRKTFFWLVFVQVGHIRVIRGEGGPVKKEKPNFFPPNPTTKHQKGNWLNTHFWTNGPLLSVSSADLQNNKKDDVLEGRFGLYLCRCIRAE